MSVRTAALWSMGAQYLSFIIQFAVSVLISRFYLTPAEVGLFSIALAATQLLAVLQEFGLTRYISGRETLEREELRVCASVALVFAWGVAAFVALLALPTGWFYGDGRLVPLMLILATSYLFVPFSVVPSAMLARDMDFKSLFFVNAGSAAVNGAAALALAAAGFSAASLAWALIAQGVTKALVAQWRRPSPLPFPLSLKGAMPIVRFGSEASALYVSGAFGVRTPDLIVGKLITLTAVGLFSRATALAGQLVTLVSGAIGAIFYPAFARLRDRGEAFAPAYLRVVASYTAVIWAVMAGLALGAEPLVRAVYGEKWAEVAPLLRWIAVSEFLFVMLPLHVDLPMLLGRTRTLIKLNMLDTAAALSLLAAGSVWGVEAAAQSRILYGVAWFFVYARFLQSLVGFRWADMARIYGKSGIAAGAAVLPLYTAYTVWVGPDQMSFTQLALSSGLGGLAWLASLKLVKHPAFDEIAAIAAPFIARLRPSHAI
jgi:O-antigen/teichoic acid export membrane protein